ncbi:hypothetical protein WS67_22975 [Burkholderia singularis]|uniref:Uncharacterized protein n=1 Tax=Burkholderia singularis TaxID=1503053 RepID=A0A118DLK2_9BURK|nr:hypothetical protein WS67_22975 [Burkholderia singularis]
MLTEKSAVSDDGILDASCELLKLCNCTPPNVSILTSQCAKEWNLDIRITSRVYLFKDTVEQTF